MKLETLVVTVDQTDRSLAERMNLQTDTLIGNQCGRKGSDTFVYHGHTITYLNAEERGVGRNRNLVLEHAAGDICILADDDMRFVDGYPEIAAQALQECPDADVLIFNLIEKNPKRYRNTKICRIRPWNYGKYGAARLALRRSRVLEAGISFHTLFGGGACYSSGEDTIFLKDCLRRGLKVYAVPYALAEIDQTAQSTWFTGYHEKYFHDRGALYAYLYPVLWPLLSLRFLLLKREKYCRERTFSQAFHDMRAGAREFKKRGGADR